MVTGDTDGNGIISATDYIATKQHLKSGSVFTAAQTMAADMDENGTIGAGDYLLMKYGMN